jgi:hypothetical protein
MADMIEDPYAGVDSDEERQVIYQGLIEQYHRELALVDSQNDRIYKPLSESWDHYRSVQLDQDAKFLRAVMTLSGGVFGVSFAFINSLVPFQEASHKLVMVAGWGFFFFFLVISVLCHIVSSFVHGRRCDDIVAEVAARNAGSPYSARKRWYYGWVMSFLEWASFTCFLGGMVCLVCFVWLNL